MLQAGAAEAPDLALFTGDANDLGSIQDDWEAWFAAGKGVLEHLPLMMVHGNHEINSRHYYSQFPMPGNQQWYCVRLRQRALHRAQRHAAVERSDQHRERAGAVPRRAICGQTQQTWKLVTHHRPEYTSSTGHPPATDLQQAWESILDAHHVDLVLNGHAHAYERSHPLVAGQVVGATARGRSTSSKAAAAPIRTTSAPQAFTAFALEDATATCILDVSPQKLTLTAKDTDGTVIDSYSITK